MKYRYLALAPALLAAGIANSGDKNRDRAGVITLACVTPDNVTTYPVVIDEANNAVSLDSRPATNVHIDRNQVYFQQKMYKTNYSYTISRLTGSMRISAKDGVSFNHHCRKAEPKF